MARVGTYLNFARNTEEAFNFYKSVFGGEFSGSGISRLGDVPGSEGMPKITEEDKNLIMHIELPILDGHLLMGTDAPESMGFHLNFGNNMQIKYSLGDGRKVTAGFTALIDKTKVVEIFESENVNSFEAQREGWQSILNNFKKYAESN